MPRGAMSKISGNLALVKIAIDSDFTPIVPVLIPHVRDVRILAHQLHRGKKDWQGIAFGWEAEYHASKQQKPPHSKMEFTPAEFWIGDSTIWGFSMMWEDGDEQPPSESLSDENIVKKIQWGRSIKPRLSSR